MKEKKENDIKNNIKEENNKKEDNKIETVNNINNVSWGMEALRGNFMPAMIMIEQNKINVNDIVQPLSKENLLHLAGRFGYFNVIRTLIEKFNADLNIQNINGHTLLFYIVSTTNPNLIHFNYLINQKNLKIDLIDRNGMNLLVHSVMTCNHFPFLYLINEGISTKIIDSFGNQIIYFAIIKNNKFALNYLINNDNFDLNHKYSNNSLSLGDILISNENNSMIKYLVKYHWKQIDLNSIISCRKNILSYNFYNIYNYELLNTLYYFKTKSYFDFIIAILRKNNIEKEKKELINNNNILNKENKSAYGYYYKYINLRIMIYNLLLPLISPIYKFLFLSIYFFVVYFITNEKNNPDNEKSRPYNYIFDMCSIFLLNIIILFLLNSKKVVYLDKEKNFLEEISLKLKSDISKLPDIEEICPCCAHIKKISTIHCYLCKGCVPYRLFHSNLFGCCISKSNIIKYIIYLLLKINFYYICLMNLLRANPTNNGIRCALVPFRHKTSLYVFIIQSIILSIIIIIIGHLISILFSISVKTPYKYIFNTHKTVYYKCLNEKKKRKNANIVQFPEINDNKKIKNIFEFLFNAE